MAQVDFAYEIAADSAGLPLAVSIFADREQIREEMREDVEIAGFTMRECGSLALLLEGEPRALGELVYVDCPSPDAADFAALSRLDTRIARSGAKLIVSTSLDGLESIFACFSKSSTGYLVNPSRGERVICLGRFLAEMPNLRVRELSKDDRLSLLRLTEQVSQLAERLDRMAIVSAEVCEANGLANGGTNSAFRFNGGGCKSMQDGHGLVRSSRPPLPDPRLVRRIIQQRQMRARFFDGDLFADPAWDMLLDLTAARVEHTRVSVTSLCIASSVPPTTALRWIAQMTDAGLLERIEDETDRRRAFIQLSDKAVDAMARYFDGIGKHAAMAV